MLRRIINRLFEFCSLPEPKDAVQNKRKAGFTIVELMVVIIIVNLLSGIAVPKLTDLIERTKERTDLLKFYYLRDALNRALYEDDVTHVDETAKCGSQQNNATTLNNWLKSEKGVSLFIIELHDIFPANYQGENKNRTSDNQNMCGLLSSEGFWSQAFRDAGFGAVADIVIARADNNNFKAHPGDYVTEQVKVGNQTWTRSYPKKPLFNSKALNGDPLAASGNNGQKRLSFKIRWTRGDDKSHSLEVFVAYDGGSSPFVSRLGTCFSTQPCKY